MTVSLSIGTLRGSVAAMLLTLVGCAPGTASPSSAPASLVSAAQASASAHATASASAALTDDTNDGLGAGSTAQVVTTDLVVRSAPVISDASTIFQPTLNEPSLLYVVDGPVSSDGYEWYEVQPFGMDYLAFMSGKPPFGWVAASGRDGEAWIAPASLDCPQPDLETVRNMSNVARLTCYSGRELVLEGEFSGCFVADPAFITPEWLTSTGCHLVPVGYSEGAVLPDPGGLPMRISGDVALPNEPRARIVVTGHVDDPAATTCELRPDVGAEAGLEAPQMDPAEVILQCRTEFVVTEVTPVGE